MLAFENILQRIESEISQLQFTNPPKSLYEPIEYILSLGGKRIRPALTLMACNIYNNSIENAIKPALGLEVFHNFTLLHDDLMDEADKRRNKPTVHKVWNANTAILSGDAMLIAAYQLIGSTEHGHLKQVLDLFTQTAAEICGGQQFDMEFESRMDVSEEEYIEMIRLKTAVLLACSLKTGALLGGASQEDAGNLYAFGINIGLAFQLQDDLLDVYGDTATFGKNIGGDILCNKKTFLLINALRLANKEQAEALRSWMDKKEFDPAQKIQAFTSIYNELQLKQLTENKIQAYYDASVENLKALQVAPEKLTILKEVCDHLMNRQAESMRLMDTHCHLYLEDFDPEQDELAQKAKDSGIDTLLLPNVDLTTIDRMHDLCDRYPEFAFPMMGLHPTSVDSNYIDILKQTESYLSKRTYCGIGEIGIDLYWDKTYLKEQQIVFEEQLRWSIDLNLPVAIHTRDAYPEVLECIHKVGAERLKGVFHSFTGTTEELEEIKKLPTFKIGINGVVTFKNSKLSEVIRQTDLKKILLETDAPYLSPVPYRGRRNEPTYIWKTAEKVAETFGLTLEETVNATRKNTLELFKSVNKPI